MSRMKCPVDGTELSMTDRQGVEIDYCPQCRGVWLDRGELDKIIERTSDVAVQQPGPRPQQSPHDYGHDRRDPRYKKKKSLLGEIFDF
jgi:uncharacterized protein